VFRGNSHHKREDEEESAFVSMTDLMISILFIVMILMAFFARSIAQNEKDTIAKSEYDRIFAIKEAQAKEIKILETTVIEKNQKINQLRDVIDELERTIKKLKKQIENKDDKIEVQQSKLDKQDQEIDQLENVIDELERTIKKLKKQIENKDDKIEAQQLRLEKQDQKIDQLENVIDELERTIKKLKKQIENKDDKIEAQQSKLDKQNQKIEKLIQLIENLKNKIDKKVRELENVYIKLDEKDQTIVSQKNKIDERDLLILRLEGINEKLRRELNLLKETKDTELAKILDEISRSRSEILSNIKMKLETKGIKVQVDTISGIIRFDDGVINFAPRSFKPSPKVTKTIQDVADILVAELGCYSLGPSSEINYGCNRSLSILEAVQIEGHTDNQPLTSKPGATLEDNLDLSAKRAAAAFRIMINHQPRLMQFENASFNSSFQTDNTLKRGQPILSVSGYGEMRPVARNDTNARSANRRIDLRVIMTTPKSVKEAENLSKLINDFLGSNTNSKDKR
jgi:peptidoglycan hydrolase CwlO-like protein